MIAALHPAEVRAKTVRVSRYDLPTHGGVFAYGIGQRVSRWLVYALTEPDTGAVRYVGRSASGLERPKEHGVRVSRERTHKAAWIRSLRRAGKMYGVRVLEECPGIVEVCEAETRWISEGRRLGWRLTNHTDGGEGASPSNRKSLPETEIGRRYLAGESEKALAAAFGVGRPTIVRRLRELDIERRDRSAAMRVRMARMTPEQRRTLSAPARRVSTANRAKSLIPEP